MPGMAHRSITSLTLRWIALGRVYVTDPEGYRVLIFNPDGSYLARFGTFGAGLNNFGLPNGIFIDEMDNVYVADAGNNRILKFAPVFGAEAAIDPGSDQADEGAIGSGAGSADEGSVGADEDNAALQEDASGPTDAAVEDNPE